MNQHYISGVVSNSHSWIFCFVKKIFLRSTKFYIGVGRSRVFSKERSNDIGYIFIYIYIYAQSLLRVHSEHIIGLCLSAPIFCIRGSNGLRLARVVERRTHTHTFEIDIEDIEIMLCRWYILFIGPALTLLSACHSLTTGNQAISESKAMSLYSESVCRTWRV